MKGERKLIADMADIAFVGIPSKSGWDREIADPKKEPFLVTSIPTNKLFTIINEKEDVDYLEGSDTFWISGMQRWIVNDIYLVAQNDDDHIYLLYDILNSQWDWPTVLGRIKPEHEMTRLVRRAFAKFLGKERWRGEK